MRLLRAVPGQLPQRRDQDEGGKVIAARLGSDNIPGVRWDNHPLRPHGGVLQGDRAQRGMVSNDIHWRRHHLPLPER